MNAASRFVFTVLRAVQANAGTSDRELARVARIPASTFSRIRAAFEQNGTIARYAATLDRGQLGFSVVGLIEIQCRSARAALDVVAQLQSNPEYQDIFLMQDPQKIFLKSWARSIQELDARRDALKQLGGIRSVKVSVYTEKDP